MNSLDGRAVVYPEGKFDIDVLIDEMSKLEAQAFKITKIIVSPSQMIQIRLMDKLDNYNPMNGQKSMKIFGVPVEVVSWKPWCVNIVQEF